MDKILAGSARYLELLGGLREADYLMLNLPFACNYRCTKCCNSGRKLSAATEPPLAVEEIFNLLTDAKSLGARVLVIAGEGEPFLDNRIKQIVEKAHAIGLIPYIFTNGSLLDKETVYFLKKQSASLVINLDSLNAEKYAVLSGGVANLDRVIKNLELVRAEFSDTFSTVGNYSCKRIAINTVVSTQNFDELNEIARFCGNDFVRVCNLPMQIGRANSPLYSCPRLVSRYLDAQKVIPLGTTSDNNWCAYLRNGISVGAHGEVLACAYALETGGFFGNIRGNKLEKFVGKANSAVNKFYASTNHSRCLLRHMQYPDFVNSPG